MMTVEVDSYSEFRQVPVLLTIDCDSMFAPTSRTVPMATRGMVANTTTSSLKTTVC